MFRTKLEIYEADKILLHGFEHLTLNTCFRIQRIMYRCETRRLGVRTLEPKMSALKNYKWCWWCSYSFTQEESDWFFKSSRTGPQYQNLHMKRVLFVNIVKRFDSHILQLPSEFHWNHEVEHLTVLISATVIQQLCCFCWLISFMKQEC